MRKKSLADLATMFPDLAPEPPVAQIESPEIMPDPDPVAPSSLSHTPKQKVEIRGSRNVVVSYEGSEVTLVAEVTSYWEDIPIDRAQFFRSRDYLLDYGDNPIFFHFDGNWKVASAPRLEEKISYEAVLQVQYRLTRKAWGDEDSDEWEKFPELRVLGSWRQKAVEGAMAEWLKAPSRSIIERLHDRDLWSAELQEWFQHSLASMGARKYRFQRDLDRFHELVRQVADYVPFDAPHGIKLVRDHADDYENTYCLGD